MLSGLAGLAGLSGLAGLAVCTGALERVPLTGVPAGQPVFGEPLLPAGHLKKFRKLSECDPRRKTCVSRRKLRLCLTMFPKDL